MKQHSVVALVLLLITTLVVVNNVNAVKLNGIAAYYYDYSDQNLEKLPSLPLTRKPKVFKIEQEAFNKAQDFTKLRNSLWTNQFVAKFVFYLDIKVAGQYVFSTDSNDGTLLFIDGKKVVDNDGNHDMPHLVTGAPVTLTKGLHKTILYYHNSIHRSGLQVLWKKPGAATSEIIPASVMKYETNELEPAISVLSKKSGKAGAVIQVTGFGFVSHKTAVYFGDKRAGQLKVKSSTVLLVKVPAGVTGTVGVKVRTPNGVTNTLQFTYDAGNAKPPSNPSPPPSDNASPNGNPNPKLPLEKALYRINSGGPSYTDKRGKQWSADKYYVNGNTDKHQLPFTYPYAGDYNKGRNITQKAIWGTYDSTIYLTERWDPNLLAYEFPVTPGKYLVKLHFSECFEGNFELFDLNLPKKGLKGVGVRVFTISANGQQLSDHTDVFQSVGPYSAMVRQYTVSVKNDKLRLEFGKIAESPMVSGIEIIKSNDVVPEQQLPKGLKQGIAIDYYDYMDSPDDPMQHLPDFNKPVAANEVGDYLNTVMQPGKFRTSPFAEQFAAQFYGYLRVPVAGTYRITLESNDGSIMTINNIELNNNGNHRNIQAYKDINFAKPGFYKFNIKYFQGRILTCMRLYWVKPDQLAKNYNYIPYEATGDVIPYENFSYNPKDIVPVK
jgi:hypothetical protein